MPLDLSRIADHAAPISGFWMPPEIREFVDRVAAMPPLFRKSLAAHAGRVVISESDVLGFSAILPRRDCRGRKFGIRKKRDYIMVASFMCKYSCKRSNRLFSTSLKHLRRKAACDDLVMRLAGCDRSCLPVVLDVVLSLMNKHGVKVGWYSLLYDVTRFDHPDRFVQKSWSD